MRRVLLAIALAVMVAAPSIAKDKDWRAEQCRYKNVGTRAWSTADVERTIRCVAKAEGADASKALAVYRCESNHPIETPHSDSYHGPFQYHIDTFRSHLETMPSVVKHYGLTRRVHNVRSNLTAAVAWSARYGWQPWECG